MLTAEDLPFVRYMNSGGDDIDKFVGQETPLPFGTFLPTHSYPVMTPGYTAHWSPETVVIARRAGDAGRMIFCINCSNMPTGILFLNNKEEEGRTPLNAKSGNKNMMSNLKGWFNGFEKWSFFDKNPIKSVKIEVFTVIPLMIESTLFDALIVVKRSIIRDKGQVSVSFGFIRVKQLIDERTALSTQYGVLPALEIESEEEIEFFNYKSFLVVILKETGRIRIINLYDTDQDNLRWSCEGVNCDNVGIKTVISCPNQQEDDDLNFNLLIQNRNINSEENEICLLKIRYESSNTFKIQTLCTNRIVSLIDLNAQIISLSFIKNNLLYVIAGSTITEVTIKNCKGSDCITRTLNIPYLFGNVDNSTIVYSFPWQLDLKCSALMYSLIDTKENDGIVIEVCSIDVDSSKVDWLITKDLLSSDCITISNKKAKDLAIFASSSFELFILEKESRKIIIYSGLLIETDWNWSGRKDPISFEFSQWFNIFSDFPVLSFNILNPEKCFFVKHILNDLDLHLKNNIKFPPNSWQSLSTLCRALKGHENITVPYLMMLLRTPRGKIEEFYNYYSLTRSEVSKIELFYHLDHGNWEEAVRIFCGRCGEDFREVFEDIVEVLSEDRVQLDKLAKFAAGRIISIDFLITKESTCKLMMEAILFTSGLITVLEWIKGLFAWLRPEDRCALIPVITLHKRFLGLLIEIILKIEDPQEFKAKGRELVETPFEREMLESVLKKLEAELDDNSDDRAAWLITMICAARGKWHEYLKKFDFSRVNDPEVYSGIRLILDVIKSSSNGYEEKEYVESIENNTPFSCTQSNITTSATSGLSLSKTSTLYQREQGQEHLSFGSSEMDSDSFKMTSSFLSSPIQYSSPNYSNAPPSSRANLYKNGSPTLSPTTLFSYQVKSSPPFTPKHFPSKKPTRLSSFHHRDDSSDHEEKHGKDDDEDPFMEDLFRNYGKRTKNLTELLENSTGNNTSKRMRHL